MATVDARSAPQRPTESPEDGRDRPAPARRRRKDAGRRDLTLLWAANAVDGLGSQASGIVFPLLLLRLGHGPGTAGVFASAAALAGVALGPLAAVPADRGHRRRIMITTAVLAAAAMAGLAVAAARGTGSLRVLVALALTERLCAVAFEAASRGALVHLVTADELPRAAAGLQAGDQIALVAGPALGGVLFQLARPLPFLADTVSYALTAIGVRAIRTPIDTPHGERAPVDRPSTDRAPGPGARRGVRALTGSAGAGLGLVTRSAVLRLVVVWASAASGVVTLLSYTALFVLGADGGTAATGLVLAVSGSAGLLGSLLSVRVVRRLGAGRALVTTTWLLLVPLAALTVARGPWAYGAAFAGLCLLVPVVTVVLSSAAIAATPRALQSRAGAVIASSAGLAAAGAPAAAAALTGGVGPQAPAAVCTAVMAVLAGYTHLVARRTLAAASASALAPSVSADDGQGDTDTQQQPTAKERRP